MGLMMMKSFCILNYNFDCGLLSQTTEVLHLISLFLTTTCNTKNNYIHAYKVIIQNDCRATFATTLFTSHHTHTHVSEYTYILHLLRGATNFVVFLFAISLNDAAAATFSVYITNNNLMIMSRI